MTGLLLHLVAGVLVVAGFAYLCLLVVLAGHLIGYLVGVFLGSRGGRNLCALALLLSLAAPLEGQEQEDQEKARVETGPTCGALPSFDWANASPEQIREWRAVVVEAPRKAEKIRESRLFRALGIGTYVVFAGDVVSTELFLAQGISEANPFQRNRWVRVSSHAGGAPAFNWYTSRLYRQHPRSALWTRVAVVALFGGVTAHNLRQASKGW